MSLRFRKSFITNEPYESAGILDVNNDGILDIVSGAYWYEGPDFKKRHKVCDVPNNGSYCDEFSTIPLDVNGDGYMDIITGSWCWKTLRWRENPGNSPKEWKNHTIAEPGCIETTRAWDIDGDGIIEIIPNVPSGPLIAYKLVTDKNGKGTGKFEQFDITETPCGHGMGFGDVNGDNRADIILAAGWLEAPADVYKDKWAWHAEFELGSASVPVMVHDVNGDGATDLIVGQSHAYGLAWWEQKNDDGKRTWTKHDIDTERSQYHDLRLVDIDNDKELELITGKRRYAHSGHDPGGNDPVGLYYFEIKGGEFVRRTIDYGDASEASGAGIFFWVEDLDGNGWKDIIAPGKEGVYLFRNQGK